MKFAEQCGSAIESITSAIASIIRWAPVLMVLTVVIVVILRYIFSVGAIAVQELTMYLHGMLFLLAVPYGVLKNTHVRVDLLYSKFPRSKKNAIDSAGHLIFLIPVGLFILIASFPYAEASWIIKEKSSEVGGIPAIFVLKACVPIAGTLLTLQGISELLKIFFKTKEDTTEIR